MLDDSGPPQSGRWLRASHSAAGRQRATRERLILRPASGRPFAGRPATGTDVRSRRRAPGARHSRRPDPERLEPAAGSVLDEPAADVRAVTGVGTLRIEQGLGVVFVDDTVLELLGLSHEQALGQGWLDALHPDDRPHVAAVLSNPAAGDDGIDVECRVLRSGVDERWTRIRGVPVRGDDGYVAGYMVLLEDVTDARRGEGPGVRLAELAAVMQEWVGIADASWQLVYANPSARAALALPADETVRAVNMLDVFTDALDSKRVEIIDAMRRDGRWTGELRPRALDGRTRTIGCTILRHTGGDGEVVEYSFVGRDVSMLTAVAVVEALRESEERFRLIAEASTVGIFFVDPAGDVAYADPCLAGIMGRPAAEIVGRSAARGRASGRSRAHDRDARIVDCAPGRVE